MPWVVPGGPVRPLYGCQGPGEREHGDRSGERIREPDMAVADEDATTDAWFPDELKSRKRSRSWAIGGRGWCGPVLIRQGLSVVCRCRF